MEILNNKFKILFLISIYFIQFSLYAQNLHFLSVINTDDFNRPDRKKDAENINDIATNIAKYLNLTKYTYDFGDSANYNPETLKLTLKNLQSIPCSNDIIWFHYSGTGRNYEQGSLPTLSLFGGEIESSYIINILTKKNPKLLLITIDCPNLQAKSRIISNQPGLLEAKTIKNSYSPVKAKVSIIPNSEVPFFLLVENYERLFRKFDGNKIVSILSSSIGEDALSDSYKGSLWIQAFSKAVHQTVNNNPQKEIWEKAIFEKTKSNLSKLSNNFQHPKIFITPNTYCDDE